jgi:hypothetical protein
MKKLIVLMLVSILLVTSSYARIWRVNNMPGVTADFTTAQAAHNGAQAGDTIHLEPSITNYGSVTCTKKLVWISTGNFLSQNPGNQYSLTPGTLSSMGFNAGSEGSVVSVVSNSSISISVSSVSIVRSYFASSLSINSFSAANDIVTQCYFGGQISISGTNSIISNNIASYVDVSGSASAIITNNVFYLTGGAVAIANSVFQNNICKGLTFNFSNSNVSYNMHAGTGLPPGNNNLLNVDMTTVFENNAPSSDRDYRLKPGSPALAAGFGGSDMGAFGGSTPFVLALQPAIPAITNLSTPSSSGNNTIQVTFSAKSNN